MAIADRVIARHEGRIVAEFSSVDLDASVVMDAITRGQRHYGTG